MFTARPCPLYYVRHARSQQSETWSLGHSALGLCIVQPRCASEVGTHNQEGSTTQKDPEVDVCMDAAVRRSRKVKNADDVADEDTRIALMDHWLEKLRQIRQPGHRQCWNQSLGRRPAWDIFELLCLA